jgi:integrase
MPTARLLDAHCRAAKPQERAYKLFDGAGLALVVLPSGTRSWRLFYRLAGRQQTMGLGLYPAISLADARRLAAQARVEIAAGRDPMAPRRAVAAESPTFESACRSFWGGRKDLSPGYVGNALRALELHLWPAVGSKPIGEISREDLLQPLRRLDAAGRHVYVRRTRMWAAQVWDWAIEHGHAVSNPAASIKPERAFGRAAVESFAALELTEVPAFMQRLSLEGELLAAMACRMVALTWGRTQELRSMRWEQVDGDLWRVPRGTMKARRDHLVPLSTQALAVLEKMRARSSGAYVFAAEHRKDRAISENAVLALIARMGYKGRMTGHGWRSVASTWANERGFSADAIERQLAHAPADKVRAVYNRAELMPQRRQMLQAWADWLDRCEGRGQSTSTAASP